MRTSQAATLGRLLAGSCLLCGSISIAALGQQGAAGREASERKAIFEPVNYPQDLELTDVLFISEDEGWATGAAGTILHTKDGGKTWTPQLGGDPQGAGNPIDHLRFGGERTIFAAQSSGSGDHTLLRTTDGETWTESGTVGQHRGDYEFTSPTNGVYVHADGVHHSADGGSSWTKAHTCALDMQVDGLARQVKCHFETVDFVTTTVGYVASRDIGQAAFAVGRTDDGGVTWKLWAVDRPDARPEHVVFTDESTGFIKMWGGAIFQTGDGGESWTAAPGAKLEGGKQTGLQFAGRDVGWGLSPYGTLVYSVDGGKRWSQRKLQFPAPINGFSLVSPTTAYVVGEHGMAYRYRVVPADDSVPNMIDAPMMAAR